MQKRKDPLTKPVKMICCVVPKADERCMQWWLWGLLPWAWVRPLLVFNTNVFTKSVICGSDP